MLRCEYCNNLFDESDLVRSFDRDFGWVSECPYCQSAEDIIEVDRCEYCGEWTDKDEISCNNGICENCASNTLKDLTSLILTRFSHPQIMFIREYVDDAVLK